MNATTHNHAASSNTDVGRIEILADKRHAAAREMLVKEFFIESAFVGVPKLARILGIAPTTIYAYIRQGTFFLPYRMINKTVMVSLADLAEWYCSPQSSIEPCRPVEMEQESIEADAQQATPLKTKNEVDPSSRLIEEALEAMGIGAGQRSSRSRVTMR